MTNWIWMHHPETGGKAQFPAGVEDMWAARGWEPTDAPSLDPILADPEPPVTKPTTSTTSTAKQKKENDNG